MEQSLQFYARKTDRNILEIVDAFGIDKIKIGFRNIDLSQDKNSRVKGGVDFYLTIPEMDLLCHNLLTGHVCKLIEAGKTYQAIYKGSDRDGQTYSRTLSFGKSNKGLFFTACEGPGKKTDTGAVMPLYKISEAPVKVSIPLSIEEIKMFAIQGKRACDHYYAHFFAKEK